MNDKLQTTDNDPEDLLERFIDGLMSEAEAADFLAGLDNPEEALAQFELQSRINDSLCRSFSFDALDEDALVSQVSAGLASKVSAEPHVNSPSLKLDSVSRSPWLKMALAASLLLAIGFATWTYSKPNQVEAYFRPQSLASLYLETKERGFRPYYNCEDRTRFADTFEARHGQRLALSDMPQGTRMLGISYPGGISPNTTAMLGEVDGIPVMVFVDDAVNRDQVIESVEQGVDLNVFRVEENGLIFCEVTPLDSARMIQHFEFIETP